MLPDRGFRGPNPPCVRQKGHCRILQPATQRTSRHFARILNLSLSLCYFLVYPCPEGREESRDFEAKAGLSGAEEVVRYLAAPWLPSPFFPDLEVEW